VTTSVPISEFGSTWRAGPDLVFEPGPARLRGLLWRRAFAYLLDVFFISLLSWLLVLLLSPLWPAVLALVPICYHSLLIGGPRSATFGQRLFGVEVRRLDGGRPTLFQAFVQTILFYATVTLLTPLVLVVALFNWRRRALHDILAGTLTLRRSDEPEILVSGGTQL
jgi:uncharacterized RDD family membrane protein YckC